MPRSEAAQQAADRMERGCRPGPAISMRGFRVAWMLKPLTRSRWWLFACISLVLVAQTLVGCSSIGPKRLEYDQLDYSRTILEIPKYVAESPSAIALPVLTIPAS